jgi:hypothetical protein
VRSAAVLRTPRGCSLPAPSTRIGAQAPADISERWNPPAQPALLLYRGMQRRLKALPAHLHILTLTRRSNHPEHLATGCVQRRQAYPRCAAHVHRLLPAAASCALPPGAAPSETTNPAARGLECARCGGGCGRQCRHQQGTHRPVTTPLIKAGQLNTTAQCRAGKMTPSEPASCCPFLHITPPQRNTPPSTQARNSKSHPSIPKIAPMCNTPQQALLAPDPHPSCMQCCLLDGLLLIF